MKHSTKVEKVGRVFDLLPPELHGNLDLQCLNLFVHSLE